jgi:predicted GNAT family acetyltransferase
MSHLLDNPIYHALISGNRHLSLGNDVVGYYKREVSPFAGLKNYDEPSFSRLADMLPAKSVVVTVTAEDIRVPDFWKTIQHEVILQMTRLPAQIQVVAAPIIPLGEADIPQMLALTGITNPGPFLQRTIEFGHYAGIFERDRLIAMSGRRMHPDPYLEVSAVCTHPEFTGKGYGEALTLYQASGIVSEGKNPFLHVRKQNTTAIKLYEKLSFEIRAEMHMNVIQKK